MCGRLFLAFVLILAYGTLVIGKDPCEFPEALRTDGDDYWLYHVTLDGIRVKVTVNETNIYAEQIGWGFEPGEVFNGTCLEQREENFVVKYQVKPDEESEDVFICFKFDTFESASRVAILHSGKAGNESELETICDDNEQTEWLLVANKPKSNKLSDCVLTGAYTFTANSTKHNKETVELCPTHPARSLLESDCTMQEGLRLSFPDLSCVPGNTGWATEQKLMCLDTWKQGEITFQLLGVTFDEPKWCMRIPSASSQTEIQIFQDLTCPPIIDELEEGIPYIELTMEKYDTSNCEDFLKDKNLCSSACSDRLLSHYCQETCKLCESPTSLEDNPVFDKDVITPGTWEDIHADGTTVSRRKVDLTENSLAVEAFSKLQCHKRVDANTYVTLSESKIEDSCRPRYSCAKFQRLVPDGPLLAYKIGQNVLTFYKDDYDVCSESNFDDDPPPLGVTLHSRITKNLIAQDKKLWEKTVPCGFEGNFSVEALDGSTSGYLSDLDGCEPQKDMTVQLTSDEPRVYKCLADFVLKQDGPRFMVSRTGNETFGEYNCWLRTEGAEGEINLYQMMSPQCNDVTYEQIQANVADVALAANLSQVDNCKSGDTTTSTTNTESTTFPPSTTTTLAPSSHQTTAVVFGVLFGLLAVTILAYIGYKIYIRKTRVPYRVL